MWHTVVDSEEEAGQADKLWQQQQQVGRVLQWGSEKSREGGLLTVPGQIQERAGGR